MSEGASNAATGGGALAATGLGIWSGWELLGVAVGVVGFGIVLVRVGFRRRATVGQK
ncbi:hypothetical protein [Streptomyces sp. cg35]|uniref:hypothetical protein n=1 Tax=Streptomyces sp. cg35 TaxID=3421650 RepID=UPI003D17B07B